LFIVMNNLAMLNRKLDTFWSHVHALTTLADAGSFTAAAQRMGVSKAAMSQRIAELERAAGVLLVQRTTRSVRLTEAGQQLVDQTRTAFEQIERGFTQVRDLAHVPRGLVRVTAPMALGRQTIVPLLPAFLREHPQVRIELELTDRLVSLAQEGFDLAIRHAASVPDTHVARVLCSTHAWLVATRGYLRRRGLPTTPQALATHDCLPYLRGSPMPTWTFESRRDRQQRVSVALQGVFAANNSEALREAALGGAGIALLPDFSAWRDVAGGKLVVVLPQWRSVDAFAGTVYALRPYSPQVPRAVKALVDHLHDGLKGGFGVG
jgi:DNA-binding transcriptional LysR family regulator